jgi:hypothetical protein
MGRFRVIHMPRPVICGAFGAGSFPVWIGLQRRLDGTHLAPNRQYVPWLPRDSRSGMRSESGRSETPVVRNEVQASRIADFFVNEGWGLLFAFRLYLLLFFSQMVALTVADNLRNFSCSSNSAAGGRIFGRNGPG